MRVISYLFLQEVSAPQRQIVQLCEHLKTRHKLLFIRNCSQGDAVLQAFEFKNLPQIFFALILILKRTKISISCSSMFTLSEYNFCRSVSVKFLVVSSLNC